MIITGVRVSFHFALTWRTTPPRRSTDLVPALLPYTDALLCIDSSVWVFAGQNTIVVVQGANIDLSVEEVRMASDVLSHTRVLLTQLALPQEAVLEALLIAKSNHGSFTLFHFLFTFSTSHSPLRN